MFTVKQDDNVISFYEQDELVGEVEYEIGLLETFVLNYIHSYRKGYGTKMIEYIKTLGYPFIQGYLLNEGLVPFYKKVGAIMIAGSDEIYFEILC